MTNNSADDVAKLRGERRRMRTRTAILDAAEQLLSYRSADVVRVDDIAELAGVTSATVYGHFGSKDAVVEGTVERLLEMTALPFTEAVAGVGSPMEQVANGGDVFMHMLVGHPFMTRYLAVNALSGPETSSDSLVAERVHQLRMLLEGRIQAAIDDGEIQPVDGHLLTSFLFGAWIGVAALALRHDQERLTPDETQRALQQGRDIVLRGLAPELG